ESGRADPGERGPLRLQPGIVVDIDHGVLARYGPVASHRKICAATVAAQTTANTAMRSTMPGNGSGRPARIAISIRNQRTSATAVSRTAKTSNATIVGRWVDPEFVWPA